MRKSNAQASGHVPESQSAPSTQAAFLSSDSGWEANALPMIIQRNFFRLLTTGAFGTPTSPIEPMSPWKWDKLYNLALMHGVVALIHDGMAAHSSDFFMQLPPQHSARWAKAVSDIESANMRCSRAIATLAEALQQQDVSPILLRGQAAASLYPNPLHRTCGDIDLYFAYTSWSKKANDWARSQGLQPEEPEHGVLCYQWQGNKVEHYRQAQHLTNSLLNRQLSTIVGSELTHTDAVYADVGGASIEVLPPTLALLLAITRTASYIICDGLRLKQLTDLGMMLRAMGNKIDHDKLRQWLSRLHLGKMAQLEGALLISLLGFDQSEIPFFSPKGSTNIGKVTRDLFMLTANHTEDWYFTQGKNIFVRTSNSSAMAWQLRHLMRFFGLYPAEAATSFISSIVHSMSHIEE